MITLYDIPGQLADKSFTPNTRKARYALNFKGVPYRTEWVEMPDIEALYKTLGLTTTETYPDGVTPFYTLPIITDDITGSTVAVADSWNIAVYLDEAYPDAPALFPKGTKALQAAFETAWMDVFAPYAGPILLLRVHSVALNPISAEQLRATREPQFGKRIEEVEPQGDARVQHFKEWETKLGKIAKVYEMSGAKYLTGDEPVYADLIAASWVRWLRVLGKKEDWELAKSWHGGLFERITEGMQKYEQVPQ